MSEVIKAFKTKAEAQAFVQGVEYVNDSAIVVKAISRSKGADRSWLVEMEDREAQKC